MSVVISIAKPLFLLLIPIAVLYVMLTGRNIRKMYRLRRILIHMLRISVVSLLVLALAGTSLKWNLNTVTTVFVVDASDSTVKVKSQIEAFVEKAVKLKPEKDYAGVIAFGAEALAESFVSREAVFDGIQTRPNGMFTDIEKALTAAVSLFPDNSRKRIVLLTDGKENSGESNKLTSYIKEQGIDFKVVRLNTDFAEDAAVESIEVPKKLSIGEEFSIVVNIQSKINTMARLSLISGRDSAVEERVQLQKGMNRFVFRDKAEAGGLKSYRAVIEPDADSENRNNEATAIINVLDKPRILVIEDKEGEADEAVKMLEASDMEYKRVTASGAPSSLQELSAYKTVITCNVSAENLNEGFLNSLEPYVRDMGGGFIAAGGEDSFALGGYYKTPLEKVLPVNMELKGKKEIPDMTMLLIIDKSGSMSEGKGGITKLDIAKEAAARTLDSLRQNDSIGVIAFDDTVYWVVDTQKAENTEKIRDDIGTIRPGGGTSILPALEEGYETIRKVNSKIKHIILLTDGQAERTGYEELISKISNDKITVSTVAVGQGSDTQLLESIAKGGNGRYYFTEEFSNIPRIFAKETFMAARAYLNNREFAPALNSFHPILSGAAEHGLPSLFGYVAATPKDTSRVILSSDQEDPILTIWQYGLGKTAAWNSDISGKWSANYVTWEKNLTLWQNIINWTIEKYSDNGLQIETAADGNKGTIKLISSAADENTEAEATIVTPALQSFNISLQPVAPGEFVGSFDINETGGYLVKAVEKKNGEISGAIETGITVQYSPEYSLRSADSSLDRLVKESEGAFITEPQEVYRGKLKNVYGILDLTNFLIIAALIIFFFDIALRRLNINFGRLEVVLDSMRAKAAAGRKQTEFKTINVREKANEHAEVIMKARPLSDEKPEEKTVPKTKQAEKKKESLDTSMLLKKKKNRE
ncbi:MAG: VWA domain-containing protein [Bacillota bacterium]